MKFCRTTRFIALALFTAFFLAACGGGGGGGAATPVPVPEVTTASASSISLDNALLNGTVNPSGLATTYHFEWGTSSTLATFDNTTDKSAGAGTAAVAVSDPISGLSQATTYYFRLAATNSAGTTKGLIVSLATASPLNPPIVQTFAATSVTVSGATLNANVIPNGLTTNAHFEWGTDNTFAVPNATPTQAVEADNTSHQISANLTGLTTGIKYYFRVVATNSRGTSNGATANFTTNTLAPTVAIVAASPVGTDNALLKGTVNPNGLATTYHFEWGTDNALNTSTATPTLSAGSGTGDVSVSALISGLHEATAYYFRVVATNATGTSQSTIRPLFTAQNAGPVAVAHYSETVYAYGPGTDNGTFGHTVVSLLGSESFDLFGTITSYLWEKIAGASNPTLADPTADNTTFIAPSLAYGETDNLVYQITVTDNRALTGTDNISKFVKWGYLDDFSTNSTGAYQVFNTLNTGGTFSYDAPGQRARIIAGDNTGIKILKLVPISNTGVFSFDFTPTSQAGSGGSISVRLNDGGAYLELSTLDGKVRKVWPSQPDDVADFPFTYSQGSTYHISITYSQIITTFEVTGGPGTPAAVDLVTNTNSLAPIYFEIESTQQSSYFDNFKLEAAP